MDIKYRDLASILRWGDYACRIGTVVGNSSETTVEFLHGRSKPRKQQVEKIEKALPRLGAELTSIAL